MLMALTISALTSLISIFYARSYVKNVYGIFPDENTEKQPNGTAGLGSMP
jgi:hypothetical protein